VLFQCKGAVYAVFYIHCKRYKKYHVGNLFALGRNMPAATMQSRSIAFSYHKIRVEPHNLGAISILSVIVCQYLHWHPTPEKSLLRNIPLVHFSLADATNLPSIPG